MYALTCMCVCVCACQTQALEALNHLLFGPPAPPAATAAATETVGSIARAMRSLLGGAGPSSAGGGSAWAAASAGEATSGAAAGSAFAAAAAGDGPAGEQSLVSRRCRRFAAAEGLRRVCVFDTVFGTAVPHRCGWRALTAAWG
jgi:hypothetical protein